MDEPGKAIGVASVISPVWGLLDEGLRKAIKDAVGVPSAVIDISGEGAMHEHALHLVTEQGEFFFKNSKPKPERAWERSYQLTVEQAETTRLLPVSFPAENIVEHGVATDGTAWLLTEWHEGRNAYDRSEEPDTADRLVKLAGRTVLPAKDKEIEFSGSFPDLTEAMRKQYLGNWELLALKDCSGSLWTDEVEEWVTRNTAVLAGYEKVLAEQIRPTHVISKDAHAANAMFDDVGPGTLIDGSYGLGPGESPPSPSCSVRKKQHRTGWLTMKPANHLPKAIILTKRWRQ